MVQNYIISGKQKNCRITEISVISKQLSVNSAQVKVKKT